MNQNINDSNLIFRILFLKLLLLACNAFIFVHTFQWTSSDFFLIFRFSSRTSQSQQKLAKKITHLTIQFRSKHLTILRTSTHLTLKIICSHNAVKNLYDFTNFPANMFLFGVRKNIWAAPFLDTKELHSWSTLKANVCIFLYISVRKVLFQRRSKILSDGGCVGDWGEAE